MAEAKRVGWNANDERLLALIVINDAKAERLSGNQGEAFFRAFIVKNRATGEVSMNFRLRYKDGDSWFNIKPNSQAQAFQELRSGIIGMVREAASGIGVVLADDDVEVFEPPDDGGDFERTIGWLRARDLIHAPTIERTDDDILNSEIVE